MDYVTIAQVWDEGVNLSIQIKISKEHEHDEEVIYYDRERMELIMNAYIEGDSDFSSEAEDMVWNITEVIDNDNDAYLFRVKETLESFPAFENLNPCESYWCWRRSEAEVEKNQSIRERLALTWLREFDSKQCDFHVLCQMYNTQQKKNILHILSSIECDFDFEDYNCMQCRYGLFCVSIRRDVFCVCELNNNNCYLGRCGCRECFKSCREM